MTDATTPTVDFSQMNVDQMAAYMRKSLADALDNRHVENSELGLIRLHQAAAKICEEFRPACGWRAIYRPPTTDEIAQRLSPVIELVPPPEGIVITIEPK